MEVIILLILISILVAGGFLVAYFWAVKSGQFDDTKGPSVRMLLDEQADKKKNPTKTGEEGSDSHKEKD